MIRTFTLSADRLRGARPLLLAMGVTALLGTAARADSFSVAIAGKPEWMGPWQAIVSGSTTAGVCATKRLQGAGASSIDMGINFAPGASDNCPARVLAFARGQRPLVMERPDFTMDGGDRIRVEFKSDELMQVKIWILTCVGELGKPCAPDDTNFVRSDAVEDFFYALSVYNENMLGLSLGGFPESDAHETPAALEIERLLVDSGSGKATCAAIAERLKPDELFQPAVLNVYYTSRVRGRSESFCVADPEGTSPAARAGFVMMAAGAPLDVLTHEIGHALGLEHPGELVGSANIMKPGTRLNRCVLGFDQAYEVHAKQNYLRYRPAEHPTFNPFPTPATSCGGTQLCTASDLEQRGWICPHWSRKIVLDWVRCLHCPADTVPRIDDSADPSGVVPYLKNIAAGYLRVEDRQRITEVARTLAVQLAAGFPELPRDRFMEFYSRELLETIQERAATALGDFSAMIGPDAKRVCSAKAAAWEALEYVLRGKPLIPGRSQLVSPRVKAFAAERRDLLQNSQCPTTP